MKETFTPCPPSMLTDEQFERARRLAPGLAGIEPFDRHRERLHRRSDRIEAPRRIDGQFQVEPKGAAKSEIYGKGLDATAGTPSQARIRLTSTTPELRRWVAAWSTA